MTTSRKPSSSLSDSDLLREVDEFILEAREILRKGVSESANSKGTQATTRVEIRSRDKLETA